MNVIASQTSLLRAVFFLIFVCVDLLHAQVATYFIDKSGTFTRNGEYWYQEFTLSKPTVLVLRFTSDYGADAAVVTSSELQNFINARAFSGYAVFDNTYGTKSVALPAGTYYFGIRNQTTSTSVYRAELDYDIQVPADGSTSYSFVDQYIQGTEYVAANGGTFWQEFTIQSGFRYFLDGCNSGLSTYVITASELSALRSGAPFNPYSAYSGTDMAYPGLDEIKLNPGSYYLVFVNTNSIAKPVTFNMERWKASTVTGGGLDLSSPASWKISGTKVNIKVAKISNLSAVGDSGPLRLRLWATKSQFCHRSLQSAPPVITSKCTTSDGCFLMVE